MVNKILFSRLRYVGYALMCPASLLFISAVTKKWIFLQKKSISFILFIPSFITILAGFNVLPSDYLTHSYQSVHIYGLSVVNFKNGPLFFLHYLWSNVLILSAFGLLFTKAFQDSKNARDYVILSLGMICGYLIDLYNVIFNSPLRFTMISAGTFLISEYALYYIAKKNGFFGLIKKVNEENSKFHFQNKLLSLLGHDLTGNIHQLSRLSNTLLNSDQDNQELIKVISDTSLSSEELISNIMRWAKSQDGNDFVTQYEKINLKELINHILESLSPIYPGIKQQSFLEISNDSLYLNADKEMLSSILRNLLTNAYKASKSSNDSQLIKIKVHHSSKETFFEISDNGIGLDQVELENIFQMNKIKKSAQGYGIGLHLVKMLVEIHQGTIKIESQKNRGTQVYLSLPL